jgi:outer membrane protein TolC
MNQIIRRLRSPARAGVFATLALALVGPLSAQTTPTIVRQASSLSLDEALHMAEGGSEDVAIARAGVLRARGEQYRARSEFFPQLYGTASYTRTLRSEFQALADNAPPPDPDAIGPKPHPTNPALGAACRNYLNPGGTVEEQLAGLDSAVRCGGGSPLEAFRDLPFGQANQWRLGLSLSQNVFAGGRIAAQYRAARAGQRSWATGW